MLRVTLLCVGRPKAGLERDLAARYLERAAVAGRRYGIAVEAREVEESRARRADDRKREEAVALSGICSSAVEVVALDETGLSLDSSAFANLVGAARDTGRAAIIFAIGGADGLDADFRHRADHVVGFGSMTWPHQLVRLMAAEQIYRSVTILAGHPYHRA